MARREYSPEEKAAAMAALLAGQGVDAVAKEFKIPAPTLRSWKSRQTGEAVASVATEKKEQIGLLLLDHLEVSLATLKRQVQFFANEEWLRKQPAAEAAVLYGVIADKTFRLFEALAAAEDRARRESEPDDEEGDEAEE